MLKLADILDNLPSIHQEDPRLARLYASECAALLPALQSGDPKLWAELRDILSAQEDTNGNNL